MQAQKFRDQRTVDTSHKVKVRLIEIIIFHLMHKNPAAPVTITRHVTWLIHIKLRNINLLLLFFFFFLKALKSQNTLHFFWKYTKRWAS